MLMSHENNACNSLSFRLKQRKQSDEIGLFECELGLIEYLQTRKMGLFEYNESPTRNRCARLSFFRQIQGFTYVKSP
jgi:hypothetical protein